MSPSRPGRPDLSALPACVEEARAAAVAADPGPPDPTRFADLRSRLAKAAARLPPLYRRNVLDPLRATLDGLGAAGFARVLRSDPERDGPALVLLDVAQSVLQNGERYREAATDGFQEIVSDLYDGFLSAEDRRGVKPPDKGAIPPLVKWGRPDFGPYTLPVDAVRSVGVRAAIVSLPPASARRGLLAWAALGHETAGHDVLGADTGLRAELAAAVRAAVRRAGLSKGLPDYWGDRIDETASDVLGILNLGPAAGAGIIGYFRALNAAWGSGPRLRSVGPADDEHPADVLRGWLAAASVRRLSFAGAEGWADALDRETDADAGTVVLAGRSVGRADARGSAVAVAEAVAATPLRSLEGHALGEIQDWRDADEAVAADLRSLIAGTATVPDRFARGIYAAHALAAGVYASLAGDAPQARIFERTVAALKAMHDANPSWGPLYVVHPGDLARRVVRRR
jgi:hypothetical protein